MNAHSGWIEFRSFRYEGTDPYARSLEHGQYLNPILAGFYPDPSVVRVDGDYYLVNSSFAWYPGVPVFHSRDLVNWTQIGHVLNRPSQLPLDGAGVSRGIFAPVIRYHKGRFFMITTNVSGPGNFYVTAKNPAGPWSDPVLLPQIDGIDPSLFFDDDGRGYIVHCGPPPENKPLYDGHRAIWLTPLDEMRGAVSGPGVVIVNGGTDLKKHPIWVEGPHLFRRGGFYYLIAAEGGTADQHSEVVFRSKAVTGPYESYSGNPILTQRTLPALRRDPVTSAGHADFVETANGEWWAVFLACRPYGDDLYNTGRETFLLPVKWQEGWPTILPAGEAVPRAVRIPRLPASAVPAVPTHGSFVWTDEFRERELPLVYNFLRVPTEEWWSLTAKPGSLLIKPRPEDLDTKRNPSLIAHRQQHAEFSASVEVVFRPDDPVSDAGLTVFQNETHNYFLGVRRDSEKRRAVFLEKRDGAVSQVGAIALPDDAKRIVLKADGDGAVCRFRYRVANGEWKAIGGDQDGTILSTKKAGGFVGAYIGMFARSR